MTNSYRISDGRSHGYRIGDLFETSRDIKDITIECKSRILAPIVDHNMALFTISVLGLQGSGKTEICKYLTYTVQKHYGIDDVNTIVANDPSLAYKQLNEQLVQLIVIDDAAQHLSSQSASKRSEFDDWFMIRHLAERASGCGTGRVITIFNWQRYSSVHPNFRNPDLWLFSSAMADTADIQKVRSRTGNLAYDSLSSNWDSIQSGDQYARSNVMARIPARPLPGGVGWFRTRYMRTFNPEWQDWPKLLHTAQKMKLTHDEALDILRDDEQYNTLIKIYDAYKTGKKQSEIADEMNISQSHVSQSLTRLNEIIDAKINN